MLPNDENDDGDLRMVGSLLIRENVSLITDIRVLDCSLIFCVRYPEAFVVSPPIRGPSGAPPTAIEGTVKLLASQSQECRRSRGTRQCRRREWGHVFLRKRGEEIFFAIVTGTAGDGVSDSVLQIR